MDDQAGEQLKLDPRELVAAAGEREGLVGATGAEQSRAHGREVEEQEHGEAEARDGLHADQRFA